MEKREERAIMSISGSENQYFRDTDFISYATFNLLTARQANREYAMSLLHERGYDIQQDSNVQIILVDIIPYFPQNVEKKSDAAIQELLMRVSQKYFPSSNIDFLVCTNRYRQYLVLLCSNTDELEQITRESYNSFYEFLCREFTFSFSCYLSEIGKLGIIKEVLLPCDRMLKDNVSKTPGLYFLEDGMSSAETVSVGDHLASWEQMLNNQQFSLLKEQLLAFIDFHSATGKFNQKSLRALHQELTKLFFVYTYKRNLDMEELFEDTYSYDEFMNCFQNVFSLKQGVSHFIQAISTLPEKESAKGTIQEAMDYITENLSDSFSISDVAEFVHFSPEYLSKRFKEETGQNIKKYILEKKLEAAKNMLCNSTIPIHEVAVMVGYCNFSHFSQLFKKYENMTPSEYRKQHFSIACRQDDSHNNRNLHPIK